MKYHTVAIASLVLPFLAACGQTNLAIPNNALVTGAITALSSDYSSLTVNGQTYQLGGASLNGANLNGASLNGASLSIKSEGSGKPKKFKLEMATVKV